MNQSSHQIQLLRRPVGLPSLADFTLTEVALPELQEGEVRVANQWLSVDPYMRGRMSEAKSYVPLPSTAPRWRRHRRGGSLPSPGLRGGRPGEQHAGLARSLRRQWRPADPPARHPLAAPALLGALGMPGMTAWTGLNRIAKLQAGETVLVFAPPAPSAPWWCSLPNGRGPTSSAPPGRSTRWPTSRAWGRRGDQLP